MSRASNTTRRWDGLAESESDRRFFDLRESGYRGPIDQVGNPMVGASPAVVESAKSATPTFSTDHSALTTLMGTYPPGVFAPPEDRVRWLFDAALELDRLGYVTCAQRAREDALIIVRAVIGKVAGGARR